MRASSADRFLKYISRETGVPPAQVVEGLRARTPSLTSGERAELLEAAETDFLSGFGRVLGGVTQGLGYVSQGAQAVSSFASLFGGSTAQSVSRIAGQVGQVSGQVGQGTSQVGSMLQALRGGRVPPLPGPVPSAPTAGGVPAAPRPAAASGQFDATALLQQLLSNPQLQQALRAAPLLGQGAQRSMELVVPTEKGPTKMAFPLGAVVETVAELAARSAAELEMDSSEALPADRAALVLHYFRMAGEAERFGEAEDAEADDAEAWAVEMGL